MVRSSGQFARTPYLFGWLVKFFFNLFWLVLELRFYRATWIDEVSVALDVKEQNLLHSLHFIRTQIDW
jgi:hypothetical protein